MHQPVHGGVGEVGNTGGLDVWSSTLVRALGEGYMHMELNQPEQGSTLDKCLIWPYQEVKIIVQQRLCKRKEFKQRTCLPADTRIW